MSLAGWFETGRRASGEEFSTLKDGAPEWLREAVQDAHDGDLPNDWVYSECRAACAAIDHGDLKDEDSLIDHADGRVDVYTKALFGWAAEMCGTTTWASAEEAADESGGVLGCEERFRAIQFHAVQSIARSMLSATEERTDEDTEALR